MHLIGFRSSRREVFCKKGVLRNLAKVTEKHLCQSLVFLKGTLAQVFSCEYGEISRNTFSYRLPPVTASVASSTFTNIANMKIKVELVI